MNFLPFFIARKIYFKEKTNYTIFFITILSRIGIFISVFALMMSFSALNGFQKLLNQTILSTIPHAIITFTNQSNLTWKDTIKKINTITDVSYAEPYILINGLLTFNNKLKTVEIKSFSNIEYLKKNFISLNQDNIFIKKKI
ncbi:hypothetical protein [Buchnera aphidicola]|uniref:hypothetical protein n=1 Tax=Buchnera aphidicola TaxID=9 RepID=UPI0002F7C642|nr:hypothetical protein [Buchnera aphidicola]